jgi:uncharacterized protein YbjQ (UPF0145 family)
MPFFHRKSEEEKLREEEQQRLRVEEVSNRQASIASLEQGGIPVQAQRRLDELRDRKDFFTSDLSVNEFALAKHVGFRPLSQVMGSSIYHVGWQSTPGRRGLFGSSQELGVISQAMNHARTLALGRLSEEGQRVGADAVIGVHVTRATYEWASDLIEFSTVGTSVKMENPQGAGSGGLTNLSGQDFWKLYQAGYWPVGVVAASAVYYVVAGWQTQMANNSFWGSWANQELQDFTNGLYVARHLAMSRVYQQAQELGGQGIVGMEIDQEEEEYEVRLMNDQERKDMIFTFHAMGTAIEEKNGRPEAQRIVSAVSLDS